MIQTLPITKAREDLPSLVENVSTRLDEYVITVNGVPAAVLVSAAEYDALRETNEILDNSRLMKAIKEGEEDIRMHRVYDWDTVKSQLSIDVHRKTYRKGQKRTQKHR